MGAIFHHSNYWRTWSRVLLQPGSIVGDRPYGAYLEVNLTPTNDMWADQVKPIILRSHHTIPSPGEMRDRIPPMVVTAMIMNVGADLARRLITEDLLSEINLPELARKMRGGGIPLAECHL